jgi:hypothetical protein
LTCIDLDEAPCMVEEVAAWLPRPPMLELAHFIIWWRHWYSSIRWWHRDPFMWLFISLMCIPFSILGYSGWSFFNNSSFLFFLAGTRNPSSNKFLSPQQIIPAPCWKEEHQLAPYTLSSTNIFSLLHVLDPQRNPYNENFWVPCNLLPKSFPKNPSNIFSWTSTCSGASFLGPSSSIRN